MATPLSGTVPGTAPGSASTAAPGTAPGLGPGLTPSLAPGLVPGLAAGIAPGMASSIPPGKIPGTAPFSLLRQFGMLPAGTLLSPAEQKQRALLIGVDVDKFGNPVPPTPPKPRSRPDSPMSDRWPYRKRDMCEACII
jgi:hypothetical protein